MLKRFSMIILFDGYLGVKTYTTNTETSVAAFNLYIRLEMYTANNYKERYNKRFLQGNAWRNPPFLNRSLHIFLLTRKSSHFDHMKKINTKTSRLLLQQFSMIILFDGYLRIKAYTTIKTSVAAFNWYIWLEIYTTNNFTER